MTDSPNIIFLVWDACRLDESSSHAPFLNELIESNITFRNAITPATWSLPSHVSLFTGKYPHEHGVFRPNQQLPENPLCDRLRTEGYQTYAVSANPFMSPNHGFDIGFDEFFYTLYMRDSDGINSIEVYDDLTEATTAGERLSAVARSISAVLGHDRPLKSMHNVSGAVVQRLASNRFHSLNRIPFPIFNSYALFSYDSTVNTGVIENIIQSQTGEESPSFIFSNYMDTHRPYYPPDRYMEEYLGDVLSYREIEELSREYEHTWNFLSKVHTDTVDEAAVSQVQELYRGEVRSADDQLRRLVSSLEQAGELDDTLLVITADHGENLGELTEHGTRDMGHEGSESEHLTRVPLVVANPSLEHRTVDELVSTKELLSLFTEVASEWPLSSDAVVDSMVDDTALVSCEYPPKGTESLYDRYPAVPEHLIDREVSEYSIISYDGDYRLVMSSEGRREAWLDGEQVEMDTVPDDTISLLEQRLETLMNSGEQGSIDDETRDHLVEMGYL